VNDFRPITLLNCYLKIITELLANRLQKVILPIIHKNQYGFLKGRNIQDCLAWAFEYIYQCSTSNQEIILLNLDFAIVFDTIDHGAMINIMKHMGFDDKWLDGSQQYFLLGNL
jgi:retron-type reverse transcriptase